MRRMVPGQPIRLVSLLAVLPVLLATSFPLGAASHLWRINELFSSADGTVQFIELRECFGATMENFISGKEVESIATGLGVTFTANLVGPTNNQHLLLGTAAFAALPGAPTPDYIIPSNFFSIAGDTIWYAMPFNYDHFTFGMGALPTNGVNSMQRMGCSGNSFSVAVNSPTNFDDDTGSVVVGPQDPTLVRGDCNADGNRDISDPITILGFLFPSGPAPVLACDDACDGNDDGGLDLGDAVTILASLFGSPTTPLPAPNSCAVDPTGPDGLGCADFASCP